MLLRKRSRLIPGPIQAGLMLLALPAASATAAAGPGSIAARANSHVVASTARIRFLQVTPGQSAGVLEVTSGGLRTSAGGRSTFGELTPYASAPAGAARLEIGGAGKAARTTTTLAPGARYTVVATGAGGRSWLRVYRDGDAQPGTARLRMIHSAPELGTPDIRLGRRVIAQALSFGQDTGYIDVTPGTYSDQVLAPHGKVAIVARRLVLQAGTATTAFVTGTAGRRESIVVGADQTITPGGPPQTGLGGLANGGGARWSLIGLLALCGGCLAAGLNRAARRRRG